MAKNNIIDVVLFGTEIGKVGYDVDKRASYFQYNPSFLDSNTYTNIFPYVFKRIKPVQVFTKFEGETFRALPPMIADSLPDMFGNIIFKEWFEAKHKAFKKITPLEQLTYVASRGMGALEYRPSAEIPKTSTIQIDEIVEVLNKVLDLKKETSEAVLNDMALLNVFKIGTSAGGARPKILISEHKKTGQIIPGDMEYSNDYNHYLVKLCMNEEWGYNKEKVEYIYCLLAKDIGITMMPSKLIDNKHFATLRYDRQNGKKKHVLTASGLTGWDFKKPENSSYENLFQLALDLKVPYKDIQELFKRMVFNVVLGNIDDHLKNHSFMYDETSNSWSLAPAYDLTYPLNINFNYSNVSRALSINNKRQSISLKDVLTIAETYAIKNPKGIIKQVQDVTLKWNLYAEELEVPKQVSLAIKNEFFKII
ncbi:type II toxin-antitoxin system HipA family toxin [Winogradskyella immobilis]|uniref:Type II toxin-antitoxin system HipA family toxin n=1 Tax=Winogradskyella immobilis TaxID=2816852 RepID=A0ABS8EPC4_9FLAO|nr:type II toxin-antitoxin system HipA family toxin [Winogradskyella immobilis]MCC1484965.1 type II toxin-antitoxin system HipA family toxin [Winogradskyella immobilis]MCG0017057.1 type II toxin-antitoxin system HipA family toxin [Winogradskyella immobilis]